jgi:hypothetical protein
LLYPQADWFYPELRTYEDISGGRGELDVRIHPSSTQKLGATIRAARRTVASIAIPRERAAGMVFRAAHVDVGKITRLVLVLVAALALLYGVRRCSELVERIGHVDYGRVPQSEVFRMVWGQPVPKGVTGLSIGGHGGGQGHIVFMRIRAQEPVLRALIGKSDHITKEDFEISWSDLTPPERSVGWSEIDLASNPEYFAFNGGATQGWIGTMALDRTRNALFVFAFVL